MAATPLTDALYVDFLKEWYRGTVVADLTYKNHPLLGIMPKNTNVRGEVYPKPIQYANIAGRSALYSNAHNNQFPAQRERWENTHIDNYAKATVTNKVMALSQGNDAAFREALTSAFDSAYSAFANDMHFECFGSGTGVRGSSAGAIAGLVITLGAGEARFFEVNMVVEHCDDAVPPVTIDTNETVTVTAVDRTADTITVSSDFTTPIVATDGLVQTGDLNAKASGLNAWLVTGAAPGTFNGVNRDLDPVRLAGVDGVPGVTSGLEITESLVNTGAIAYREGAMVNLALLHPTDVATLAQETEQRGRYAKVSSTSGSISFSALEIMTGAGAVPVIADPAQTTNVGHMLDTSTWELFSAGEVPSMFDKDGNKLHRVETADQVAFYLFGYYNVQCTNPGGNAKIAVLDTP